MMACVNCRRCLKALMRSPHLKRHTMNRKSRAKPPSWSTSAQCTSKTVRSLPKVQSFHLSPPQADLVEIHRCCVPSCAKQVRPRACLGGFTQGARGAGLWKTWCVSMTLGSLHRTQVKKYVGIVSPPSNDSNGQCADPVLTESSNALGVCRQALR